METYFRLSKMSELQLFNQGEQNIISLVVDSLGKKNMLEEMDTIKTNEMALSELRRSISLYPSILGKQSLGQASRSIETLVDTLCLQDTMDMEFHIPSKAILGQGYSLAKINYFYMLLYLVRELERQDSIEQELTQIISDNIFTIMAEKVFISIISDKDISLHIRSNAGYLLANIWEYRIDHGVEEFAPILTKIWHAREDIVPAYGTMLGTIELLKLSEKADTVLYDFLQREELSQNEIDSLQEFLMGLSHEEICEIKNEMKRRGKNVINSSEIKQKLSGEEEYSLSYDDRDPPPPLQIIHPPVQQCHVP